MIAFRPGQIVLPDGISLPADEQILALGTVGVVAFASRDISAVDMFEAGPVADLRARSMVFSGVGGRFCVL